MKAGIVGFSGVGKRTLFELLTQVAGAPSGGYDRGEQMGVLKVPDPKLGELTRLHDSRKTTPATIEFVLIPSLVKGRSTDKLDLGSLRNVDVLVHVVRAFDEPSVPHPEGSVDAARDIEVMELELTLADLAVVEKRHERMVTDVKKGNKGDPRELELLGRAKDALAEGKPLRSVLSVDERDKLKGYALLTAKPMLAVVNVDERLAANVDENVVDHVDERLAANVDENVVDHVDERLAANVDENVVDHVDERLAANVDENVVVNVDERLAANVDENVVDHVDERLAANVDENVVDKVDERLAAASDLTQELGLEGWAAAPSFQLTFVSARIEAEIAELPPEDARAFREDLGLKEGMVERIVRAAFELLQVITFYTAGDTESRAWIIPRDTRAAKAAGTIHSDMERGFIRAEVVPYDVLVAQGSWNACRDKGLLRLEGKDYPIHEADVVYFRFNV